MSYRSTSIVYAYHYQCTWRSWLDGSSCELNYRYVRKMLIWQYDSGAWIIPIVRRNRLRCIVRSVEWFIFCLLFFFSSLVFAVDLKIWIFFFFFGKSGCHFQQKKTVPLTITPASPPFFFTSSTSCFSKTSTNWKLLLRLDYTNYDQLRVFYFPLTPIFLLSSRPPDIQTIS